MPRADYDTIETALNGRILKMVTLNVQQSHQPSANLKVTIILENLASGNVAASVFELPDCRVEAETREEAIISCPHNRLRYPALAPVPSPKHGRGERARAG